MVKAPENDNLVMESIEDLYLQADGLHADINKADLSTIDSQIVRDDPKLRPIIGSLPIALQKQTPDSELSDMVLMGQKAASSETKPFLSKQRSENKPLSADKGAADNPNSQQAETAEHPENPFLAIRQAVISAGHEDQPLPAEPGPKNLAEDMLNEASPQKRTFSDQIAQLIDQEIEKRLQAHTNNSERTQKSEAQGKKRPAKKAHNKAKTAKKTTAKSKTAKQAKAK